MKVLLEKLLEREPPLRKVGHRWQGQQDRLLKHHRRGRLKVSPGKLPGTCDPSVKTGITATRTDRRRRACIGDTSHGKRNRA